MRRKQVNGFNAVPYAAYTRRCQIYKNRIELNEPHPRDRPASTKWSPNVGSVLSGGPTVD